MIHDIKRGDTLSALAQRYGTTVDALARANGIEDPDLIYAGRTLEVPGATDSFEPAPQSSFRGGDESSSAPTESVTTESVDTESVGGGRGGGVTQAQLQRIMPQASPEKLREYLPHLNEAMAQAGINTPKRQAAFLAQLAHESVQLRYMEEIASGAAYEGRRDLGNTQPGDGVRFKGRGPIQLTGRANYTAASRDLGIDLVSNPSRAADPDVAFKIATWFWNSRDLNSLADAGNFGAITYRVNGGYNGAADRNAFYARALQVLT